MAISGINTDPAPDCIAFIAMLTVGAVLLLFIGLIGKWCLGGSNGEPIRKRKADIKNYNPDCDYCYICNERGHDCSDQ